jgi:hypothetical protein
VDRHAKPWSRGATFVVVVETAEVCDGDDPAIARRLRRPCFFCVTPSKPPQTSGCSDGEITILSTSSSVISSLVRSYSFVVRGDSCAAMVWAFSMVPPFSRQAVMPVARNVWQHVEEGGRRPRRDA